MWGAVAIIGINGGALVGSLILLFVLHRIQPVSSTRWDLPVPQPRRKRI